MADDFGAPNFSLTLNGTLLNDDTLRYVQYMSLEESISEIDMLEVRILLPDSTTEQTRLSGMLKLGAPFLAELNYGTAAVRKVQGDIVERSIDFSNDGTRCVVLRGFDGLFRLKQKRLSRHWNSPISTIVSTIASEHTLTADTAGVDATSIHEFQNNESNAAFLKRLASQAGCRLSSADGKLSFTPLSTPPTPVTVKPTSLARFQVTQCLHDIPTSVVVRGWDVKTNAAVIGTSITASLQKVSGGMSGPEIVQKILGDNVLEVDNSELTTATACKAYAQSLLQERAFGLVDGTLVMMGRPELVSGSKINIKGVGNQSGNYLIRSTCHSLEPGRGYETALGLASDSLCSADTV